MSSGAAGAGTGCADPDGADPGAAGSGCADPLDGFQARIGHRFADPALLALALSHSSWAYENGGAESNERLEFLGDAVLSVCVVRRLYRIRPAMTEGEMSHVRSEVVSGSTLAAVAAGYGVGDVLRLGRGEDSGGGRTNPRLLEDAFEAVIGAVFLDGGDAAACDLVMRALGDRIAAAIRRA